MSSVRFHRILRRGREYGPRLSPSDALAPAPPNDPERGLHFVCLNANILRQFEFLQNAWIVNTKFSALTGESDPLLWKSRADTARSGYRRFHAPTSLSPQIRPSDY
jgi:deferrochelatase/peroxidase EfeB